MNRLFVFIYIFDFYFDNISYFYFFRYRIYFEGNFFWFYDSRGDFGSKR